MAVTRKQKEASLAELTKSFEQAASVFFSQYQGTNVKNMRELRKKLLGAKVNFKVAKKTLMTLAAKKVGFDAIPEAMMKGPIGLAFSTGDSIAAAKILHDFGKTVETVKMTGGIFEGRIVEEAEARAIALLPSKEQLLARLVGSMKAPISGFHSVLHGLLRNFVYALAEVQKKKPA